MRRAVGLAVGLAAVLAMTGVAVASEHPASSKTTVGAPTPLAAAAAGDTSKDIIGTVEPVSQVLDYLGARRAMTFHHPGASYMKVHFNRLLLLPGDYVEVTDAKGVERHTYSGDPLRAAGELAQGGQWAMSVDGDTAVVTLHTHTLDPAGVRGRLAGLGVGMDRVARGFTPAERDARRAADRERKVAAAKRVRGAKGREESVCGHDDKHDAVCYRSSDPVAYARSKAVARVLIDGVELCSAWRVGPNNRMFTNHHCFTDTRAARNTEVWFNYECAACGGYDVLRPTKVWGDKVVATDERLDYTLFSVQNFESVARFGFLQLDPSAPRAGEELYIPQHPGGDPTKIAMNSSTERNGNCAVADPSYAGYDQGTDLSYHCDTEGGSSGSPVLSRESNAVIGLHHFGGCPNSGVRIDLIYEQVASLL